MYELNEYKVDEHLSEKWYKNFEDSDEDEGLVNFKKIYQRTWYGTKNGYRRKNGYQLNSYENGQKEQEFY